MQLSRWDFISICRIGRVDKTILHIWAQVKIAAEVLWLKNLFATSFVDCPFDTADEEKKMALFAVAWCKKGLFFAAWVALSFICLHSWLSIVLCVVNVLIWWFCVFILVFVLFCFPIFFCVLNLFARFAPWHGSTVFAEAFFTDAHFGPTDRTDSFGHMIQKPRQIRCFGRMLLPFHYS